MSDEEFDFDPQILAVVNAELERVKQEIRDGYMQKSPDDPEFDPKSLYVGKEEKFPPGTARLRLDWELLDEDLTKTTNVLDLMFAQVSADLTDLLENGDTSSNDPLYHSLNGKKKTGRDLEKLTLGEVLCYREAKPLKNSIEYTMYLLVTPTWA